MSIALQVLMIVVLCLCAPFAGAAETSESDEAAVNNPVELQPLQQLNATKDKPLFAPTRRPPPKPVVPVARQEPPPPPPPPPSVVVLGIVSENGSGRAAIRTTGRMTRWCACARGDDVGGLEGRADRAAAAGSDPGRAIGRFRDVRRRRQASHADKVRRTAHPEAQGRHPGLKYGCPSVGCTGSSVDGIRKPKL